MGAKEWHKLEWIACDLPLIPDNLWVAGSNNVPVSGSHKKCSVRTLRSLASIVGGCRSGANEHAGRLGRVAQAAASYDGPPDPAVHSPRFRNPPV